MIVFIECSIQIKIINGGTILIEFIDYLNYFNKLISISFESKVHFTKTICINYFRYSPIFKYYFYSTYKALKNNV